MKATFLQKLTGIKSSYAEIYMRMKATFLQKLAKMKATFQQKHIRMWNYISAETYKITYQQDIKSQTL